ncbi:hypothetical protein CGRA01v4_06380 [Colletotrichum graminicola]|nr:hypothetical protein CGRA01v4_06380 [Colletotrichum graminicola]
MECRDTETRSAGKDTVSAPEPPGYLWQLPLHSTKFVHSATGAASPPLSPLPHQLSRQVTYDVAYSPQTWNMAGHSS